MPHPEGYFDLVYAISVFTHITHEWTDWLLELHRVLKRWPKPPGQGDRAQEAILTKVSPGHGVFVGRKRDVSLTSADLLRPEPDDPREEAATRQQEAISADEAGRGSS